MFSIIFFEEISKNRWLTTWLAAVGAVGLYLVGLVMYFGCRERKKRGWLWATPQDVKQHPEVGSDGDRSPLIRKKVNVQ
jgi:hypothetical protein